ncbi:MAG TPA: hypothetical protein VFI96_06720 [Longimicrobiaceae bacterium]|nr:hypothetical protein [Longimicrobiaceae bacterium]
MRLKPLLLAPLLLAACAPHPTVQSLVPGFSGVSILRLEDNLLATPGPAVGALAFGLERVDSLGRYQGSAVVLESVASPALGIRPEAPLRLRIDGDTLSLPVRPGSVRRSARGAVVQESARYSITLEQMQRLADAHEARVRVRGDAVSAEGRFTPRNLAAVRDFLQRFAEAARQAAADSIAAVQAEERAASPDGDTAPPDTLQGRGRGATRRLERSVHEPRGVRLPFSRP